MVYCHEFLSDRWSYRPYVDHLRDLGFDIFTFDFRNHGESRSEPGYRADALGLRSRGPRPPRGAGLPADAARSRPGGLRPLRGQPGRDDGASGHAGERDVWGVITDGAFPTIGTMMAYILRWAELYLRNPLVRRIDPAMALPRAGPRRPPPIGASVAAAASPTSEKAVARLAPRPWLMIHGQRDTYISPEIVEELFDHGNGPKEMWLVPDAKHNRCREREPEAYAGHLLDFVDRYAPRRPITESPEPAPEPSPSPAIVATAVEPGRRLRRRDRGPQAIGRRGRHADTVGRVLPEGRPSLRTSRADSVSRVHRSRRRCDRAARNL